MKARSEALKKFAAKLLKSWENADPQYVGVRFDSEEPQWKGGYGVPVGGIGGS